MDLNTYQELALRSCSPTSPELAGRFAIKGPNATAALEGVAAALRLTAIDHLKKYIFYGRPIPNEKQVDDKPIEASTPFVHQHIELVHCILGLLSEIEELLEAHENGLNAHQFDTTNIAEELGDMMWYIAQGLRGFGVTMEQAAQRNVDKLRHRYPQKFTDEAAVNRDLEGERKILEGGATVEACITEIIERAGAGDAPPEILRAAGELLAECRNRGGIPEIHPAYDNDIPGEDN